MNDNKTKLMRAVTFEQNVIKNNNENSNRVINVYFKI